MKGQIKKRKGRYRFLLRKDIFYLMKKNKKTIKKNRKETKKIYLFKNLIFSIILDQQLMVHSYVLLRFLENEPPLLLVVLNIDHYRK